MRGCIFWYKAQRYVQCSEVEMRRSNPRKTTVLGLAERAVLSPHLREAVEQEDGSAAGGQSRLTQGMPRIRLPGYTATLSLQRTQLLTQQIARCLAVNRQPSKPATVKWECLMSCPEHSGDRQALNQREAVLRSAMRPGPCALGNVAVCDAPQDSGAACGLPRGVCMRW